MSRSIRAADRSTGDSREAVAPIVVGPAADVREGGRRCYVVGGTEVTVLNVGGVFYAVENTCPHMGGPLGEGAVRRTQAEHTIPTSRFRGFDPRRPETRRVAAPPSEGTDRLTIGCPWHGWEFDLDDGSPRFPAKRGVRTYAVRIEDGVIILEPGRRAARSPAVDRA